MRCIASLQIRLETRGHYGSRLRLCRGGAHLKSQPLYGSRALSASAAVFWCDREKNHCAPPLFQIRGTMAFATKEDLDNEMVDIESIKIRMTDIDQQLTDNIIMLSENIGSNQTELSEKIEGDQVSMSNSKTLLILNSTDLQGTGE